MRSIIARATRRSSARPVSRCPAGSTPLGTAPPSVPAGCRPERLVEEAFRNIETIGGARGGPAAGWRGRELLPGSNCLSQTNRRHAAAGPLFGRNMRASTRRSASTSASAQSRSSSSWPAGWFAYGGRPRRNLRTRSSVDCACSASSRSRSTQSLERQHRQRRRRLRLATSKPEWLHSQRPAGGRLSVVGAARRTRKPGAGCRCARTCCRPR